MGDTAVPVWAGDDAIRVQIDPRRRYDAPWSAFLVVYRMPVHPLLPPIILFVVRDPACPRVDWHAAMRHYPIVSWHLTHVMNSRRYRCAHRRAARRLLEDLEATYVRGAIYFLRATASVFPEDVRRAIWAHVAPRARSVPAG